VLRRIAPTTSTCLQRPVAMRQATARDSKRLDRQVDAAGRSDATLVQHCHLGKCPVDTQSEDAHCRLLCRSGVKDPIMGHTTPTDSRSAHSAKSGGGQILTRALSSSDVPGLPSLRAPRCLGPGWSHHSASHVATTEMGGTAPFIPDTNVIERLNRTSAGAWRRDAIEPGSCASRPQTEEPAIGRNRRSMECRKIASRFSTSSGTPLSIRRGSLQRGAY
jgi:hypothetical protein